MNFRPYSHPLNWYPLEVSGSVELLSTYVEDIEQQVNKGIADYNAHAERHVVNDLHGDEVKRMVTAHRGLDDETWCLTEIFGTYFPNLQRRSALITLFSFFEHELDKLCERCREHDNFKVKVNDMAGTSVKRSITYLKKVVGLDVDQVSSTWLALDDIRRIRNLIVHSEGKLLDNAGKNKPQETAIVAKTQFLEGTEEVILNESYLAYVLMTIDQHFKSIDLSLKTKYGF